MEIGHGRIVRFGTLGLLCGNRKEWKTRPTSQNRAGQDMGDSKTNQPSPEGRDTGWLADPR